MNGPVPAMSVPPAFRLGRPNAFGDSSGRRPANVRNGVRRVERDHDRVRVGRLHVRDVRDQPRKLAAGRVRQFARVQEVAGDGLRVERAPSVNFTPSRSVNVGLAVGRDLVAGREPRHVAAVGLLREQAFVGVAQQQLDLVRSVADSACAGFDTPGQRAAGDGVPCANAAYGIASASSNAADTVWRDARKAESGNARVMR